MLLRTDEFATMLSEIFGALRWHASNWCLHDILPSCASNIFVERPTPMLKLGPLNLLPVHATEGEFLH